CTLSGDYGYAMDYW
nr:immunoglobulin heavy chain junction region [Mus musculus]